MKRLMQVRDLEQRRFADHPVFTRMADVPMETLLPALAYTTGFWAMGFQDLIRMVDESVEDAELKKYAGSHRAEDTGHQLWLFDDLQKYGYGPHSKIFSFFENENFAARLHTYRVVSQLLRLNDDRLRVALLLAVESAGHVFFAWMARLLAERGVDKDLKYFGGHHIAVEKAHTVFESTSETAIADIELEAPVAEVGVEMVRRVHQSFSRLADDLIRQLDDPRRLAELRS
ncbi:MAG: hypothetical protein HOW73_09010 [Polyangiaceae bacterium]|nr:hypothetical protein [Polyangiaceae bacterium]